MVMRRRMAEVEQLHQIDHATRGCVKQSFRLGTAVRLKSVKGRDQGTWLMSKARQCGARQHPEQHGINSLAAGLEHVRDVGAEIIFLCACAGWRLRFRKARAQVFLHGPPNLPVGMRALRLEEPCTNELR